MICLCPVLEVLSRGRFELDSGEDLLIGNQGAPRLCTEEITRATRSQRWGGHSLGLLQSPTFTENHPNPKRITLPLLMAIPTVIDLPPTRQHLMTVVWPPNATALWIKLLVHKYFGAIIQHLNHGHLVWLELSIVCNSHLIWDLFLLEGGQQ